MPHVLFTDGELLTAAKLNDRLVNQAVNTLDTTAQLNALTAVEGMVVYLKENNTYYARRGGVWVPVLQDTGWMPLSLQNGWTEYFAAGNTSGSPPRYRRINGIVHLKGLIKSGGTAAETLITTIPATFRPAEQMHFPAASSGSLAYFGVNPDGRVVFKLGSNTWYSLDGASWVAEG